MRTSFLILRSKSSADATVRLQSDAVLRGLQGRPGISAKHADPTQPVTIESGCCVLFHFDDAAAIAALKHARTQSTRFVTACFGSDIYDFKRYLPSYDVADMFIMPTEHHRQILASEFYKPVYYLPESIDPITGVRDGDHPTFAQKHSKRLLWFGYPESFYKGMGSLIPVLKLNQKSGHISDFTLILNPAEFINDHALPTLPFRTATFRSDAAAFDYCILSHFSLDLSLNSYIKSPNKLLTALMIGLIPIASKTPNYAAILGEFGLQRFLFESPEELHHILRHLDPATDSQEIARSGIIEALAQRYSAARIAENLLEITVNFDQRDPAQELHFKPRPLAPLPNKPLSVSEHLKDLVPSVRRSIRWHLTRPSA
jgi:hypothetical protein